VDPNTSGRGDGRVGDHGGEAAPEQRQQAGGGHGGGGKVLEEEEDGERPVRVRASSSSSSFSFEEVKSPCNGLLGKKERHYGLFSWAFHCYTIIM
jgi:hypothetical protein